MGWFNKLGRFFDDAWLPDNARAALETGEHALGADAPSHAEVLFREVLAHKPGHVRASLGLAEARWVQGDPEGARVVLADARQHRPDSGALALMAAHLAFEAKELDEAAACARTASMAFAKGEPEELGEALELCARVELERGRPDRAAREARKAIAARPTVARQLLLLDACARASQRGAALQTATALRRTELDTPSRWRVSAILVELGASEEARSWLAELAEEGDVAAWEALAGLALRDGEATTCVAAARRAIEGGVLDALEPLAEALIALERGAEAADALEALARHRGDPQWLERALAATPLDATDALGARARRLADEYARAARVERAGADASRDAPSSAGLSADAKQAADVALAWVTAGAARSASPLLDLERSARGRLLAARRALEGPQPLDALAHLDAWALLAASDPLALLDLPTADSLRRLALRRSWITVDGEVDLAAAIDATRQFGARHALPEVEREAAKLRDELDRPLLLATLGEFNAGKSTLVNAFIGAEVAPMGVLPTTASLNVLRGGAERRVRVVRTDGSTREGDYASLDSLLASSVRDGRVDRVEILLPSEMLERAWILDTPGTNALDPDHEALALEAARRADVVLWVFDAAQPGRATEARILERIRALGRRVVTVLNKADRVPAEALGEVLGQLTKVAPGSTVALSARQALRAKLAEDESALAHSGFGVFLEHLDREVFSQSRTLKRSACASRLLAILDAALDGERSEREHVLARLDALRQLGERLERCRAALEDDLRTAVRDLERAHDEVFSQATTEVLVVVQPRPHRFARNALHHEDRAFVADILARSLGTCLEDAQSALQQVVATRIEEVLGDGLPLEPGRVRDRVDAALRPAFAAYRGYERGLLDGGALERFFAEVLPKAPIDREAVAAALGRARANASEELKPALGEATRALLDRFVADGRREIDDAQRKLETLRTQVYGPLRALREVLERPPPPDGAPITRRC